MNQSIEKAEEVVLPELQEAVSDLTTGALTAAGAAVSDFPPIGAIISGATAVGTAMKTVENLVGIVPEINATIQPMKDALSEVVKINTVVNDAVERAQTEISQMPKVELPKVELPKVELPKVEHIAKAAGGGSRKRRHIHKLSRRIERTLRRVQKKYGVKDKSDFLRRTLKHHKT